MTIEGRPTIQNADSFNMEIYYKARRDRLSDMVMDYLGDDDTDPRRFYEELLDDVQQLVKYHQKNAAKAESFLNMIREDFPELSKEGYEYTP